MQPMSLISRIALVILVPLLVAGCNLPQPYFPVRQRTVTLQPSATLPAVTPFTPTFTPTPSAALGGQTPASVTPSGPLSGLTAVVVPPQPGGGVTGLVQLQGGSCCIGGTMGETIQVPAALRASSPFGSVTRMRAASTGSCGAMGEARLQDAPWEPYAETKNFPVAVAINWVGFYVSAQFQDEKGNLSPVYCDDISVEGMPPQLPAGVIDWYSQVQCFSPAEVYPGPGAVVTGSNVTFRWPDKNNLPQGVFYQVSAYGEADHYAALVAGGRTRDTSITLPFPDGRTGDTVWYVTLTDSLGNLLDHGRCSSFSASLLTVDPPDGMKGIHFQYQP